MPSSPLSAATETAIRRAEADFPATVARLGDLVRIPSCSFPGFDANQVERSAVATAAWLTAAGFPEVRLARLPGVAPYVIAVDRRAGPGKPTLLLYAHHDVQPPMRENLWKSPAFAPTERDGRLYGRGAADDKAGIALHAASAAAWNAAGGMPINLAVLIEGEEEIGSPHFAQALAAFGKELRADGLVVADSGNLDVGVPALTTSLRGLVAVEVTLTALKAPLHSGLWGGVVPDPAMALCRLLATLTDEHGAIAVAGVNDDVRPPTAQERAADGAEPFDPARFAAQAGLLPGAPTPADAAEMNLRRLRQPTLAINAIESGKRGQAGNVIMDAAWARLGIRLVPDQKPDRVLAALTDHLRRRVPPGMDLAIACESAGPPWRGDTDHPLFSLARAALERGYGRAPVFTGCGASVPFVGEMADFLGNVPALLVGVEDPATAAHGENESVHLGDLLSAIRSQIALFGMMGEGE